MTPAADAAAARLAALPADEFLAALEQARRHPTVRSLLVQVGEMLLTRAEMPTDEALLDNLFTAEPSPAAVARLHQMLAAAREVAAEAHLGGASVH